ncbi:MAG: ATP-binding protein, partial [bacterium]
HYISLENEIPIEQRDFADVWRVHATRQGVYFFTVKKLFLWADSVFKVWPINAHSYSHAVDDTIYFCETGVGLMRMAGDKPEFVSGSERFGSDRIDGAFRFDENGTLLFGTRDKGLFLYDGKKMSAFKTEADDFLKTNLLYSGAALSDGRFALGTIRGGVAIIDKNGRFVQKLDMATGLRDQTIISAATDRQGGLWLALINGIARVEVASPFSRFTAENGLEGGVESIRRHNGVLYAATHRGVFYLEPQAPFEETPVSFKQVEGLGSFSWSLYSFGKILLAATDDGVFEITGTKARRIEAMPTRAFSFYRDENHPDYLFVGLINGLGVLKKESRGWKNIGRLDSIEVEIRSIAGDQDGNLWLGTNVHGAFLIENFDPSQPVNANKRFTAKTTQFDENVLPVGEVNVFRVGSRVIFGTERGIRHYDRHTQTFKMDPTFGVTFADTVRYIGRVVEDSNKNVWIFSRKDKRRMIGYVTPQPDGTYRWHHKAFRRIADIGIVFAIYPEPENTNVTWFGGTEGLARFDRSGAGNANAPFHALIRRVSVDGDSAIFGGLQKSENQISPILPYQNNAMRFEFAATSFDHAAANQFQYMLEGFDADWSEWSGETKKDYTNLPENDYRFRVRARNIYEQISIEDIFVFAVLPPWYRTWWAYAVYLLMISTLITGIVRLQVKRIRLKAEAALLRQKEQTDLREAKLRVKAAEAEKEVEKQQMRSRIASDLHDEIGSNLSSISIISQTLQKRTQIGEPERKRLGDIQNVAQQTANSMRDIVWFINPVNDSLEKLIAKMRDTANLLLEHLYFSFETDDFQKIEIDLNKRRNLFLIYKESLQNIVKHAQASHVEIVFTTEDGVFAMQITDNGVGFDPSAGYKGLGLKNFARRAEEMGAEVQVDSQHNQGTIVRLRLRLTQSEKPEATIHPDR